MMSNTVMPDYRESEAMENQVDVERLRLHGKDDVTVEWDADAKVTPNGSLVFFSQYLQSAGLMDRLCEQTPLAYTGNNAPKERDVLGTIVLSILMGQKRYAQINAMRNDPVSPELLGFQKMVSEDSVRRAFKRGTAEQWDGWLTQQERAVYEPLLSEPYVLDIDNTIKPIYGNQEGAEVGYNPKKPGRPSHNYHTYLIGSLRVVLGVEVSPGKQHSAKCGLPGLWSVLDSLPAACRPRLIRGDIAYGNETIMVEAEERAQRYLFRLKITTNVRRKIREMERNPDAWIDAGEGWQGTECAIELTNWSTQRRCIILRRSAKKPLKRKALPEHRSAEFDFIEQVAAGEVYEYTVLITNDQGSIIALAQLYRERADCENVFDEIKNQWGWGGFMTQDLKRCRIIARLIALIYNWWNIFARLARPDQHMEAITSRPLLLNAVGRLVKTGRQKILHLTSAHAQSDQLRLALNRIGQFLNDLSRTAEQLSVAKRWAVILSAAFIKWLRGKILHPVTDGAQILLQLGT
jgi:hypothetical protein